MVVTTLKTRAKIAIIGGGPSGLCLGQLMHQRNIPFTIYELREKPADSALTQPSGMLDLHEESGLAALRACGLYEQFLPFTNECSQADCVVDKDGNVIFAEDDGSAGSGRPEISRNALSHILLSALPSEAIHWGHKLVSVNRGADDSILLDFGPKGEVQCDFVVGADGAWSKTRKLLTDVKPQFGGIHIWSLAIVEVTKRYPDIAAMVGSGSCSILGLKNGIFSHRGAQDSAGLYVCVSSDDEKALPEETTGLSYVELKEKLLNDPTLFARWGQKTQSLLSTAIDEEAKASGPEAPPSKPLYMLPIGLRWEAKSGVALIGDSAHLMMPWAGEGVNLALWDSLELAKAIEEGWRKSGDDASAFRETMVPLVSAFDEAMFERSKGYAEETWKNSKFIFAEDGAENMAKLFQGHHQPPP